ncbi:MAG: metallophosphoesterase [Planctomycetota bacterium]|nr:metallophosphoesterase [Planctomycetota bacterium]
MRITSIESSPFHELPYSNVAGGEARKVVTVRLPFFRATVDSLPQSVEAILVAADLQGRERMAAEPRMLGEVLAEELCAMGCRRLLPPAERIGVILAGDLYSYPDLHKRGGSGDVRPVFRAFARVCKWVVGVAGNHDMFGVTAPALDIAAFQRESGVHLLDGNVAELCGLKIAGVSGVIGNPKKPFRRDERSFSEEVKRLAAQSPDLLVLHDGPDVPAQGLMGWPSIRAALESVAMPAPLVVRGHAHWDAPLATLAHDIQVLNVDSRVVVLQRAADCQGKVRAPGRP